MYNFYSVYCQSGVGPGSVTEGGTIVKRLLHLFVYRKMRPRPARRPWGRPTSTSGITSPIMRCAITPWQSTDGAVSFLQHPGQSCINSLNSNSYQKSTNLPGNSSSYSLFFSFKCACININKIRGFTYCVNLPKNKMPEELQKRTSTKLEFWLPVVCVLKEKFCKKKLFNCV